ncbi:uncharacterized protein LOC119573138 [Penaeus monodon]|uniref:uncharacterized protein LOC119573138 n=1 Tax=Penaeus monodon TaxID=6687 RepID=UPI0018A6E62A|nr:uncharacterized protein LOC119573138 [Penaeus monodon]
MRCPGASSWLLVPIVLFFLVLGVICPSSMSSKVSHKSSLTLDLSRLPRSPCPGLTQRRPCPHMLTDPVQVLLGSILDLYVLVIFIWIYGRLGRGSISGQLIPALTSSWN